MDLNYSVVEVSHDHAAASGYIVSSSAENVGNYFSSHTEDHTRIAKWLELNVATVCVLKNVNVDDDQRGNGYGNDALDEFMRFADSAEAIILISDRYESQEDGFVLDKWYENWGFSKVTTCTSGTIMVCPEEIALKMRADLFFDVHATAENEGESLKQKSTLSCKP